MFFCGICSLLAPVRGCEQGSECDLWNVIYTPVFMRSPFPSDTEAASSLIEGTGLVAMAGNNQRRARVLNVLREMVNKDASPAMEE